MIAGPEEDDRRLGCVDRTTDLVCVGSRLSWTCLGFVLEVRRGGERQVCDVRCGHRVCGGSSARTRLTPQALVFVEQDVGRPAGEA